MVHNEQTHFLLSYISKMILVIFVVLLSPHKTQGYSLFLPTKQFLISNKRSIYLFQKNNNLNDVSLESSSGLIDVVLKKHKPLGCIVEESLVSAIFGEENVIGKTSNKPVFISQMKKDSFADQAGLAVGDVIMMVSGVFNNDFEDVYGAGLDRVKTLISGKKSEDHLKLRVLRGTDIKRRHEESVMELCDVMDDDVESVYLNDCMQMIHGSETGELLNYNEDSNCADTDMECMLDSMFGLWNDEMPLTEESNIKESEKEVTKPNSRPWASRSSPSGTYVRDPATGKLKNIG